MTWKDITSHSQGETPEQRKEVMSVELQAGLARVVVTRLHGCGECNWFMHLGGLNSRGAGLASEELECAKEEAIGIVAERLEEVLRILRESGGVKR